MARNNTVNKYTYQSARSCNTQAQVQTTWLNQIKHPKITGLVETLQNIHIHTHACTHAHVLDIDTDSSEQFIDASFFSGSTAEVNLFMSPFSETAIKIAQDTTQNALVT